MKTSIKPKYRSLQDCNLEDEDGTIILMVQFVSQLNHHPHNLGDKHGNNISNL